MKAATFALTLATTCAAAPLMNGPGIDAGESLTYRVSWGLFSRAAEITISAREVAAATADSAQLAGLHIVTTTATRGVLRSFYPFDGEAVLVFSDAEGRLQQAEARTRAGQRQTHATLWFDHPHGEARYTDHLDPERNTTLELPEEDPLDFITSLIQIRHWNLAPGESRATYVLFDDEIYPLVITAEAIETIRTPDGPRRALRLTPSMVGEPRGLFRRGGEIHVWISADEQRLPLGFEVRVRVGTARATLVAHNLTPRAAAQPAPRVALNP
jgi:hypothetical protein